jgi:hypothetical protein
MRICSLFLLTLVSSIALLPAQEHPWWPESDYDPAVPAPEAELGYEIGSFLTDHHQMEKYIRRLEEASPRVRVFSIGQSVQRRAMYLVVIASPDNHARLEEIRTTVGRLSDPRTLSSAEADRIIAEIPAIGWLNFGTDGGETAAFEAGILTAWHLAAGNDPLTRKILDNMVVILNPVASPDSHQSFVNWMKAATIGPEGTPDPSASEHHVPWFISSDGNHFLIDVNRDAFALTQPETQAVATALHHWKPQVWIDNHGEPDEYYMAPFTAPMNLNYPEQLRHWATEVGRNCARHFDRFGWTYAKDETYDLYYPGYWDSYPALNGAVSATYETNGGGWKNLSWEKPDGTIATLRDAVHAHFIADLATLEVLAERRAEFLRYHYEFFRDGINEVDQEDFRTFVLPPGSDPGRRASLAELLFRHQVEVYRLDSPFVSEQAQTYFDRKPRRIEFPADSLVIPLRQPQKRLINTLFEPDPELEPAFLESVREAVERNRRLGTETPKERDGFYDVTAWALPLTFGLETAFMPDEIPPSVMQKLEEPPRAGGRMEPESASYAFLFAYRTDAGACLAGRLLQEDYRVAIATRGFRNSGRDYPAGTFVVRVERNSDRLPARLRELAQECGTEVRGVDTAWSEEGISLGSNHVVNLKKPKVLVFSGDPTRATAFGGVYSLLDQRFGLKFTAARVDYFPEIELSRYNVIVLPDGPAADYRRLFGDSGIDRLRRWTEDGGVLVGIKGGAEFLSREDVGMVDVRVVREAESGAGEDGEAEAIAWHPGSIFQVGVNPDYYLGLGYEAEAAVQFRGDRVFTPSRKGTNVAVFSEEPYIQGHRWERTDEWLAGKAYLADVPLGRGKVILFADDPTFRAYWRGLDRLFLSPLLFGPAFNGTR